MGKGIRAIGRADRASVLGQTVAAMVAVIVLAIAAAALPAYALIHAELDRQTWDRLDRGAATGQALVEAELARLADLATLASQRPTLQRLTASADSSSLREYLDTFRAGAGLDQVVIVQANGEQTEVGTLSIFPSAVSPGGAPLIAAIPGSNAGAVLAATADIFSETDARGIGTVTVARMLDERFLGDLGRITGMRYSLLLDGDRIATTLPGFAAGPATTSAEGIKFVVGSATHYAVSTAIGDAASGLRLETALPVAEMQRQERQALLLLAMTTVLAAAAVSGVGVVLSRRLARPLDALTRAAQRIRQGDLDTPVPVPDGPAEIHALASTLEASRVHTRATIDTLLREKAWSDALIQAIVEGIVTVDPSGRIVTFSPGAERLSGWRSAEAVGQAAANIFRTPDGTAFLENLPPPGGRRAVQVVDRAGRTMTLSITDARLRLPSNGGERLALVMRDVSDDEAVRQLRSYFLANISHEFRTPLSAIHASVELLLEDLGSLTREEIAALLHSVDLSVTGLQTLIDNLLESLSIEAGRFTIRRHSATLGSVIDQSVHVMRPLLDRREQSLHVEVPASLPSIWMDPMRVTQVIVNLLSNASKYSPVRRPIDLRVDLPGDQAVRVSVADRGEGIGQEDRENLFRRFVRLEPADPGQYGVGLGLSVVKAIVQEHGGAVGVEARPGGGSIFWFTLPLHGDLP